MVVLGVPAMTAASAGTSCASDPKQNEQFPIADDLVIIKNYQGVVDPVTVRLAWSQTCHKTWAVGLNGQDLSPGQAYVYIISSSGYYLPTNDMHGNPRVTTPAIDDLSPLTSQACVQWYSADNHLYHNCTGWW
jgi:hypothetical protein